MTDREPILITGVAGQDGIYLARHLHEQGYDVHGTVLTDPGDRRLYLCDTQLHQLDVRSRDDFKALIERVQPVHVYNLAGFSSVAESWRQSDLVSQTNGIAVLGILEELVDFRSRHGWTPRFYQASTSEMFGLATAQPQDERSPQHPRSPYAVAKSFAHQMTVNFRESYGLHASCGILFNHESPLRGTGFVTRKISLTAARIALGLDDHLTVGSVDVRRDWGYAADYVRAMHQMVLQDEAQDFVIATGRTHSVHDVIETAFEAAGIGAPSRYVRQTSDLVRPADVPELCGDPSRARDVLGWKNESDFADTIARMVEVDLRRLRTGIPEDLSYL